MEVGDNAMIYNHHTNQLDIVEILAIDTIVSKKFDNYKLANIKNIETGDVQRVHIRKLKNTGFEV